MKRQHVRVAGVGILAAGLALTGTAASADKPESSLRQGTELFCELLDPEGEVKLYVGGFFDPGGALQEWSGDYITAGPPAWASTGDGTLDSSGYTLTLGFVSEAGDDVGTLRVEGSVATVGNPLDIDERWRDGNTTNRVTGTVQELLVSGTVTAATGDLAGLRDEELACGGSTLDLEFWSSNPATWISRGSGAGAQCMIDEDTIFGLDQFGDEAFAYFVDGIDWEQQTADLFAEGLLAVEDTSISGVLDVVEPPDTGGQVAVSLTIGDLLDTGVEKYVSPTQAWHIKYRAYALTGTLVMPDETTITLDCTYTTYTSWDRFSSKAGQKPGGKPPVNDLPENALALPDGASSAVSTRGAAELPEAPCTVEYEGEFFDLPFGRTAWYEVTGTGGEILLTTEGTQFDTVMGIYSADFTQLACVDDTEETGLLASATIPTVEGETYLVQVGGFAGAWGTLVTSRP